MDLVSILATVTSGLLTALSAALLEYLKRRVAHMRSNRLIHSVTPAMPATDGTKDAYRSGHRIGKGGGGGLLDTLFGGRSHEAPAESRDGGETAWHHSDGSYHEGSDGYYRGQKDNYQEHSDKSWWGLFDSPGFDSPGVDSPESLRPHVLTRLKEARDVLTEQSRRMQLYSWASGILIVGQYIIGAALARLSQHRGAPTRF